MPLPDPVWDYSYLIENALFDGDNFFIGCISYEDRCMAAINLSITSRTLPFFLFAVDDDECSNPTWKEKCASKTLRNWAKVEENFREIEIVGRMNKKTYKMSKRNEDVLHLIKDIEMLRASHFYDRPSRCVLDVTCIPSFFALQMMKAILEAPLINELVVLYTKPDDYPEKVLKVSPPDKTRPDFLQLYGRKVRRNVKWIVSVGFDNDSVQNAKRADESLTIDETYVVVPFPGYRPEYVVRCLTENSALLKRGQNFYYAPADNPFKSYALIKELVKGDHNSFILSSFGPKPMAIGFALAAIEFGLPFLHVQATNYNPNFSSGSGKTMAFWVKHCCGI